MSTYNVSEGNIRRKHNLSLASKIRRRIHYNATASSSKSDFERSSSNKGSKFGFQDQEDGTILEGEERSVGTCYVSTGALGSVTYSPSCNPHRNYIVIKVGF
ncbi:hypothetical protein J40TS1_24750 [Paenibacillus montaniterrae]|uniref:Uncharacterized protein n=1 Tax=Paenibacillus montaniterrae TaxID=429341 RepID=A0A919YTZ9_9BACL|nr:hypothetical protein J40TS1_24750 [Paenibacillus montaniterrae]